MAGHAQLLHSAIDRAGASPAMNLPDHLAELAVAVETSTTREEAWTAVELFLKSATAKQISARGHKQLAAIVGKRIASLPGDS
jgi:antitoxin component of MazEF toxin-antitoxin module